MTETADITKQIAVPGWEGILDPGEEIVWQGRPGQEFHIKPQSMFTAAFGMFFAGFAVFWMTKAAEAGGMFWMFGLIHFSVGLGMAGSTLFGDTLRRRATWYTLTNRRAFIATRHLRKGKSLKSYPISPDSPITYASGDPATIHFARERRTGNKGRSYWANIGFERIAEGDEVIALIRAAQRNGDAT